VHVNVCPTVAVPVRHNTLLSADEAWVLPDGLVLGEVGYVAGSPDDVEVTVWPSDLSRPL